DLVANLADENDVGGLAEHAAEQFRKVEPDRLLDLRLPHAGNLALDRVFDRVELAAAVVEVPQAGVERGRLACAAGAGDEQQPAGGLQNAQEIAELMLFQPEIVEAVAAAVAAEQANAEVF